MNISRRTFVTGLAAAAGAAGLGSAYRLFAGRKRPKLDKPNIILFIADDMRYNAAGFAGNALIKTPVLDRLASQGAVFDNMFVTTSICPISRVNILSGEYALKHHVDIFYQGMTDRTLRSSFPMQLRKAGYHTGFIGKWGLEGFQPVKQFDQWMGYRGKGEYIRRDTNEHMTDIQTRQALDFLKTCPDDKPFLLVLSYMAPHDPWIPQERILHLYDDMTFPRSRTDTREAADLLPYPLRASSNKITYNHSLADKDKYQQFMRRYFALISGIDESIGTILKAVDESNTCVAFTSDNGLLNGDHTLMGKWCMYEGSIRVPLVIKPAAAFFPSCAPGRHAAMALTTDIAPTMLAMAGAGSTEFMDGQSLLPLMQGSQDSLREGFFYEHPVGSNTHPIVACAGYREKDWKYTMYYSNRNVECLFNLKDDPDEMVNLAADPSYEKKRLEMHNRMLGERKRLLARDSDQSLATDKRG